MYIRTHLYRIEDDEKEEKKTSRKMGKNADEMGGGMNVLYT